MTSKAFRRMSTGMAAVTLCFGLSTSLHAQKFVKGERPQQRGYSLAVITEGGKTVWLGGQIATTDDAGKSLAGDFEGQVRQIFKLLNATLEKAGGKLSNMVQMTVFITDVATAIASPRFEERSSATISRAVRSSRSPRWPTPTPRSRFRAMP